MWILYQLAVLATLLIAGPVLLIARGRHYLPTLSGRLGGFDGDPVRRPVWLHAVSVGEARVAGSLARRFADAAPLLLTTVTPTGQAEARRQIDGRGAVAYLPFDLGLPVRRFLDRFEPRLCLLVEGDYWPLLLHRLRRRRVPVAVVNGRVGDRTFRRLSGRTRIARRLLGPIELFLVQTERDRERLVELGVDGGRVRVTGSLKFDAPRATASAEVSARLAAAAAGRPALIAGSTMAGEERAILEAWRRRGSGLLVLAPRHPERWDEVEALASEAGLSMERRTRPPSGEAPDVLLLDSLGELAGVYGLGRAAFVGGTLSSTGGHNPIEPAQHGVPILVGPSMHNFAEIADAFDEGGAWRRVEDAEDLVHAWRAWLADEPAASAIGERGRRLVAAHRGALDRTADALAPLLESADAAA